MERKRPGKDLPSRDDLPLSMPEQGFLPLAKASGRERSLDERLLDVLESHLAAEADSLDAYRRLIASSGDPVVALLMRLVLDDEQHHHELLERMMASLHDALQWTESDNALPKEPVPSSAVLTELLAATRARIREEHQGIEHLRDVAEETRPLYGGLFTLLLECMAMDSAKHEHILRFL